MLGGSYPAGGYEGRGGREGVWVQRPEHVPLPNPNRTRAMGSFGRGEWSILFYHASASMEGMPQTDETATMTVRLPADLLADIEEACRDGEFDDPSAVVERAIDEYVDR